MRISHGTKANRIKDNNGYGYATDRMAYSLAQLGHEFKPNDPTAPVQIWFDQPHHWKWNVSDQYRIGYHPWESTRLKDDWVHRMNECDEIWTPSALIADWYKKDGVKVPVHIYEHGVDPIWTPHKRVVDGPIKFLHLGTEAARKGGMETMRAFRKAFPKRTDVKLTLKMINEGWNIPHIGAVDILNKSLNVNQLVDLFHDHHVYVYPSWGEGFGLTPLQALATGMPTITLPAWAPYKEFLDPRLSVNSTLQKSPWPLMHPGKMFQPKLDELIDNMRWVVDNYDDAQAYAMAQVDPIAKKYDWLDLTRTTFDALEQRLENW